MKGQERGQAVVEMALGTLVAVTVLLFGIFFAELGYVQVKVQEAASAPLWETTNGRMHDLWRAADPWDLWKDHAAPAGARADGLYKDFDGLSSRNGSDTLQYAVTKAMALSAECRNDLRVPFLAAPVDTPGNPFPDGKSGVSCAAQARAITFRIPHVFVDDHGQGGIFRVAHGSFDLPLCGAGRAINGACPGRFGLLLDDWGFVGTQEGQDCGLYSCNNTVFRQMAEDIYDANGQAQGNDASKLAAMVSGGSAPIDENAYFFSAQMSEKEFTETLHLSHGDVEWETTPYIDGWKSAFNDREDGWLGFVQPAQRW